MREWQNMYFNVSKLEQDEVLEILNNLGKEGWCLAAILKGVAYLKRPLLMGLYDPRADDFD